MNKSNKFKKAIKEGCKVILIWKFMKTEVCSSRNEDGTLTAEGLYIPLSLNVTKKLFSKLVNTSHSYRSK